MKRNNLIMVTGTHRSGSTFTGRMLSLSKEVGYVLEPLNNEYGIEGVDIQFPYVTNNTSNQEKYKKIIEDIMNYKAKFKKTPTKEGENLLKSYGRNIFGSGANYYYKKSLVNPFCKQLLLKDPLGCLASEWVHQKYNAKVVIVFRHPASFVASVKRLGWRFNFTDFLKQENLVEDNFREEYKYITKPLNEVEEAAWVWYCLNKILLSYINRNPNIIWITHEDISLNPMENFEDLYRKLDIPFTDKIKRKINDYTGSHNPTNPTNNELHVLKRNSKDNINRWKNILSSEEINTVRSITEPIAKQIYPESTWK